MSAVMEAQGLSFRYQDGTEGLKNLSLCLEEGKKTAVIGPNGAGKTTLFLHLNGILRPGQGKVYYKGQEVSYTRQTLTRLREKVGIVFQDPDSQLFAATVFQEVSFGPLNLGLSQEEARKRVDKALLAAGAGHLADRPTHFLSFGEKKCVSIAGVLAMEPEVIVFDEPTAFLDPLHSAKLLAIVDDLHRQGVSIILSTHDMDMAFSWADAVVVMKEGTVVRSGTPEVIFKDTGLLENVGLRKPLVLEIYDELKAAGIPFAGDVPLPRTREALIEALRTRDSKKQQLDTKG